MNYPYGQCHLCDGLIQIPGIDNKCIALQLLSFPPLKVKKVEVVQPSIFAGGEA